MVQFTLASGNISIHALREEGDGSWGGFLGAGDDFYPRPPRGGRQCWIDNRDGELTFLSTPSARRATPVRRWSC